LVAKFKLNEVFETTQVV